MADKKPAIRCSSLPILSKCLGMMGANLTVDIESEVGQMGTAVHAYAAQLIREGKDPEITSDDSEFMYLAAMVRRFWQDAQPDYPEPRVEQKLEAVLPHFEVSGHPDLFSIADKFRVVDFKSGYKTDADVLPQLMGYAYLVYVAHPEIQSEDVTLTVAWLRDSEIQEWSYTAAQVKDWMRSLHRRAGAWNGNDFTAGEHCQYCVRFHDCPARRELARSAVTDLLEMDVEAATRAELAPKMVDLYSRVQMLQRQIDSFRSWLRQDLKEHGPMECGPGKTLQLGTRSRPTIDVKKAWATLRGALDDDELCSCLKLSKTKLIKAVTAKSAPRMKGKDQAALMLALEEDGAITIRQEDVLQWKSPKSEDE